MSAQFPLFLQLRWRLLRNLWRSIRVRHPFARILTVALLVATLWGTLFALFFIAFVTIKGESPDFFLTLLDLLFSVFLLIMFLLLTFSNAILAYASLFRSWEAYFMHATPVAPVNIFWHKVLEAVLYSFWAVVLLCFPLIVAFGVAFKAAAMYYLIALALFVAFVLVTVKLGALVTVLFARFVLPSRRRLLLVVLVVIGIVVFLAVGDILRQKLIGSDMKITDWLEGPLAKLNRSQNALLPSTWLARGMMAAADGYFRQAAFFVALLFVNALFFAMAAHLLAERCYSRAFHSAQDHTSKFRASPRRLIYRVVDFLLARLSPVQRLIILKDMKTFFRTPVQWGQFVLFFGILLLYFVNVEYFQTQGFNTFSRSLCSFVNLVATVLTLSTFTIRFAFPMISLEGLNFWILGLLPVNRREILEAKFYTVLAGSLICGAPLILFSDLSLGVGRTFLLLHMVTLTVCCFGLSALAIGLGAVYPSLEEDNPAKTAAGFGGTLNLIISLAFVSFMLFALALPHHLSRFGGEGYIGTICRYRAHTSFAAVGVAIVVCGLMYFLGGRALNRLEV